MDAAIPIIVEQLERAGAPVGSQLLGSDGVLRAFGRQQSLAIYLDGVTLPDDVYATLDFDALIAGLAEPAGTDSYHAFWQGPQETGLFFFGPDAEAMWAKVEPALRAMPIGQNARVVLRAGADATTWRTVRIPRH